MSEPMKRGATFEVWMDSVEALGAKENIFDAPETRFLCAGSRPRRPYRGGDGFWHMAYESGMNPVQAIAEALVEQDCE